MDRRLHRFILSQNYMMFPFVLSPPPSILRLCIALFAVAQGWLLLDIGWFVLLLSFILIFNDRSCQIPNIWFDFLPNLTFWIWLFTYLCKVSIEHMQRVRHANRGRLLLRTPGPVPLWDLRVYNFETNLSWTCLVSGLLNFEHPSVLLFCSLYPEKCVSWEDQHRFPYKCMSPSALLYTPISWATTMTIEAPNMLNLSKHWHNIAFVHLYVSKINVYLPYDTILNEVV